MPLVTLTLRKTHQRQLKDPLFEAVHAALVSVGVPAADLFQRALSLDADDFRFDPTYPDLTLPRGQDFVLIEILWSVGRSVKLKRQLLQALAQGLRDRGLEPEHVMVVFKETQWENWSFGGGRQIHV